MNGIDGQMRIGDMTLFASDGEFGIERAAATIFDDIAKLIRARRLTHETVIHLLTTSGERFDDFDRAINCHTFFITGD